MLSSTLVMFICLLVVTDVCAKKDKIRKDVEYQKKNILTQNNLATERRAVCAVGQFSCPEKCIPQYYVCDTINDCANGFDEHNCTTNCSTTNQFKCTNGQCVPISFHCDHFDDCGDNSDETGCTPATCSSTRFTCTNGNCVNRLWICDGDNDCGDNSDEQNCQQHSCSGTQFTCTNHKCVPGSYQCDGDNDCGDHSDETSCTCDSNHFQCPSGSCISTAYKCDGHNDCGDMSDEANCPEIHPGACVDLLTFEDCVRMNATTYPVCDNFADGHRFCRKYCNLCST
jgi:hypothetical protein